MLGRPIAIALSVAATAWLLFAPPSTPSPPFPAEEPAFELPQLRVYFKEPPAPTFGDARPCLIDTVSCLELAPQPFAPCLTAGLERCSGDWQLELLEQRAVAEVRR